MNSSGAKKKIECLAVVITPLQLINASEYIFRHDIKDATLVIIRDNIKWSSSTFKKIPSLALWGEVFEFSHSDNIFSKARKIRMFRHAGMLLNDICFKFFLRGFLDRLEGCETLVIGNPRDLWLRHIANSIESNKIVDCEDGAASLVTEFRPHRSWLLRSKICRFKSSQLHLNELFTAYDEREFGAVEVISNKYSYIKSLFESGAFKTSDNIWFVGQPLVELGLMAQENYLEVLSSICESYRALGDGGFLYYPHPSERHENLLKIRSRLGVEIIPRTSVLEIALLSSDEIPRRMAFLYSSAIRTGMKIFGQSIFIDVYKPSSRYFTRKMSEAAYREIYGWLSREISCPHRILSIEGEQYRIIQSQTDI